ncbi:hypothetical protein T552_02849 [Pneumocystis carinii B80]|uniref:CS domain-containing protein n=1 Tax=Pneumocystis carinii (strain B80) TaxID=1408658 RepID=A0A0W4ZDA5_PNEC8|nr:hypothetical protein T552_02849 [Pneumocystis carinii B80]KTW26367.1 hypothetical protein T552_02849 [Pneumocystis carinii B80]
MITPTFTVEQDTDFIYINIHAVFIRTQDVEIYVDENLFIFSATPYYLRLHLPGNVVEDKSSKMSYDISSETVKIKLSKETPGMVFHDLDLISTLLSRSKVSHDKKTTAPMIEIMNEENIQENICNDSQMTLGDGSANSLDNNTKDATQDDNINNLYTEGLLFNWQLPQEVPEQNLHLRASYGFNGQYSNYIKSPSDSGNDINEIDDPEHSTSASRSEERILKEDLKFSNEHYMADYIEDDEIQKCLKWKSQEYIILRSLQKNSSLEEKNNSSDTFILTKEEQLEILKLPRKEYIIDNLKSTYLCILSLLFSYAYDARTTQGEPTSESSWTIGKLSPVLSCLDMSFSTIRQIVIACTRRALAYPLYRHWGLVQKCWEDVYCSLKLGKRWILKIFLQIRRIFERSDTYYLYNKLFLDDYSVWIQTASDSVILSLAHELHHLEIKKDEINWKLEELEIAANNIYIEEKESKTN